MRSVRTGRIVCRASLAMLALFGGEDTVERLEQIKNDKEYNKITEH